MGHDGIAKNGTFIDFKTTSIQKPLTHPGEDIRDAKAIFEQRFGEQIKDDCNLWLKFANEVREYLKLGSIEETAKYLGIINPRR